MDVASLLQQVQENLSEIHQAFTSLSTETHHQLIEEVESSRDTALQELQAGFDEDEKTSAEKHEAEVREITERRRKEDEEREARRRREDEELESAVREQNEKRRAALEGQTAHVEEDSERRLDEIESEAKAVIEQGTARLKVLEEKRRELNRLVDEQFRQPPPTLPLRRRARETKKADGLGTAESTPTLPEDREKSLVGNNEKALDETPNDVPGSASPSGGGAVGESSDVPAALPDDDNHDEIHESTLREDDREKHNTEDPVVTNSASIKVDPHADTQDGIAAAEVETRNAEANSGLESHDRDNITDEPDKKGSEGPAESESKTSDDFAMDTSPHNTSEDLEPPATNPLPEGDQELDEIPKNDSEGQYGVAETIANPEQDAVLDTADDNAGPRMESDTAEPSQTLDIDEPDLQEHDPTQQDLTSPTAANRQSGDREKSVATIEEEEQRLDHAAQIPSPALSHVDEEIESKTAQEDTVHPATEAGHDDASPRISEEEQRLDSAAQIPSPAISRVDEEIDPKPAGEDTIHMETETRRDDTPLQISEEDDLDPETASSMVGNISEQPGNNANSAVKKKIETQNLFDVLARDQGTEQEHTSERESRQDDGINDSSNTNDDVRQSEMPNLTTEQLASDPAKDEAGEIESTLIRAPEETLAVESEEADPLQSPSDTTNKSGEEPALEMPAAEPAQFHANEGFFILANESEQQEHVDQEQLDQEHPDHEHPDQEHPDQQHLDQQRPDQSPNHNDHEEMSYPQETKTPHDDELLMHPADQAPVTPLPVENDTVHGHEDLFEDDTPMSSVHQGESAFFNTESQLSSGYSETFSSQRPDTSQSGFSLYDETALSDEGQDNALHPRSDEGKSDVDDQGRDVPSDITPLGFQEQSTSVPGKRESPDDDGIAQPETPRQPAAANSLSTEFSSTTELPQSPDTPRRGLAASRHAPGNRPQTPTNDDLPSNEDAPDSSPHTPHDITHLSWDERTAQTPQSTRSESTLSSRRSSPYDEMVGAERGTKVRLRNDSDLTDLTYEGDLDTPRLGSMKFDSSAWGPGGDGAHHHHQQQRSDSSSSSSRPQSLLAGSPMFQKLRNMFEVPGGEPGAATTASARRGSGALGSAARDRSSSLRRSLALSDDTATLDPAAQDGYGGVTPDELDERSALLAGAEH